MRAPLRSDERSPLPLPERVAAAAAAGFRGLGLNHADLVAAERKYGIGGIRSLLDDNGMVHLELELLTDWWTDGPLRRDSDKVRRDLLSAAEALGAGHIKVGPDVTDAPWDHDCWVSEFAALAAEAQEAETKVGLEFLPWMDRALGGGDSVRGPAAAPRTRDSSRGLHDRRLPALRRVPVEPLRRPPTARSGTGASGSS
jgi:sugar phosphate isomerase/epimerase